MLKKSILFIGLLLVLPNPAWAEVMDKEPTLSSIWIMGFLGIVSGFVGFFRLRWLLILTFFSLFHLMYIVMELLDRFVGPAIVKEAGTIYPISTYTLLGLIILASLTGFLLQKKT